LVVLAVFVICAVHPRHSTAASPPEWLPAIVPTTAGDITGSIVEHWEASVYNQKKSLEIFTKMNGLMYFGGLKDRQLA